MRSFRALCALCSGRVAMWSRNRLDLAPRFPAVARALERAGAKGIRLKWPNDIWFDDRKVGGILIEVLLPDIRGFLPGIDHALRRAGIVRS